MLKKIISLIFILVIAGFGYYSWHHYRQVYPPYSPEINAVLFMAGDNRSELEQVLKHYSRHPADSLKLRAAEFLIVNMPGKYSEYYDAPWNDVATVRLRWTSSSNKQLVLDTYGLGEPVVKEDVRYITADYLINNIELAFQVWQETPWGKHIPFDTFCEEILPYRVSIEPLENWREKALDTFSELYEELKNDSSITSVMACWRVNNLLPQFNIDNDFPPANFSMLLATQRGICDNMAALAAFAMRALGIPVTVEFTPKWPNNNVGHAWNSVCDSNGRHISFMGTHTNPGAPHQGSLWLKSKVYRRMFSKQQNMINSTNTPAELQNPYMQDVSQEYDGFVDVEIPVRYPATDTTGYVYLATMGGSLNWNLISWGQVEQQIIRFSSIGKNVLYLPVYYGNNHRKPACYPFWLNNDGTVRILEPDTTRYEQLNLSTMDHSVKNLWDIQNPQEQNIYELFCWMDSTWQSLEKQESKNQLLQFCIPSNALFYLKNNTTGKVTNVFTVQEEVIQWL
ncbi:hypothetical protein AGMMS50239_12600 [Bacteroidia bacterium]|nr:hypothetical protein AGMMS50239_12600 [Bacteroidia bacterium]